MNNLKYYNLKTLTSVYVSYRIVDENNVEITKANSAACFSALTYGAIPPKAKKIIVIQELSTIPYDKELMERWIKEINDLGFPCSIGFTDTHLEVTINLDDYKFKMHVSCVLQLIRCLYERYIAFVPEHYFSILENEKITDIEGKFEALQLAHKNTCMSSDPNNMYASPNTNHMITYNGNFKTPLKQKDFLKRLEETQHGVFGNAHTNINMLWKN